MRHPDSRGGWSCARRVAAVLAILLQASIATAGAPDDSPDSLNEEGVRLYREGRYGEAIALFREAHARTPRAHFLYNLARCYQHFGDLGEARATLEALLGRPELLKGKYAEYRAKARKALAEVEEALDARLPPATATVRIPASRALVGRDRVSVPVDAFEIDAFEVTGFQYAFCERAGACAAPAAALPDGRVPVRHVTWQQAAAYCAFVGMRLPSEAEWERAAQGPTRRRFPWGEAPDCGLAVLACSQAQPRPPGSAPADRTEEGVFDVAGNVSEWVGDWYADDRVASPRGPSHGVRRTVRGGSYECGIEDAETSDRFGVHPTRSRPDIGFRCARSSP